MTTSQPSGEPAPVQPAAGSRPYRLSDHERTLAINALSEAFTEGRLDAEEFRERMSVASEAKLASDLDPLFFDLPGRTPSFLQRPKAGPRQHAPQRRPQGPRPAYDRREHYGRPPAPFGGRMHGGPHPVMFLPLIVLIIASTQLWFFLPLLFITMGMLNPGGRHYARRISGCSDRRNAVDAGSSRT